MSLREINRPSVVAQWSETKDANEIAANQQIAVIMRKIQARITSISLGTKEGRIVFDSATGKIPDSTGFPIPKGFDQSACWLISLLQENKQPPIYFFNNQGQAFKSVLGAAEERGRIKLAAAPEPLDENDRKTVENCLLKIEECYSKYD